MKIYGGCAHDSRAHLAKPERSGVTVNFGAEPFFGCNVSECFDMVGVLNFAFFSVAHVLVAAILGP